MAVQFEDLPFDDNGILQGVYRLVHKDPAFEGELGLHTMRAGVSTTPIHGRQLRALVGEYGNDLFLEPWGVLPKGFELPEQVSAEIPANVAHRLKRAPWRDAAAEAFMPLTLELLKLAGEGGPADFARAMAEVPDLSDAELQTVRALYLERVSSLRADGYVEIPKALEGALVTIDARIAALGTEAPKKRGARLPKT